MSRIECSSSSSHKLNFILFFECLLHFFFHLIQTNFTNLNDSQLISTFAVINTLVNNLATLPSNVQVSAVGLSAEVLNQISSRNKDQESQTVVVSYANSIDTILNLSTNTLKASQSASNSSIK